MIGGAGSGRHTVRLMFVPTLQAPRRRFAARAAIGVEAADGYERLIHDAMVGDPTLFIRSDEVDAAWRIVDPYLKAWADPGAVLHFYESGTWGPHMADLLLERSGDHWRNPVIDLELTGGRLTELPQ